MSETVSDAVRTIEQGHIRVGPTPVTDPAMLVTRRMEDFVTWVDTSARKRTIMKYNDEVSVIFEPCGSFLLVGHQESNDWLQCHLSSTTLTCCKTRLPVHYTNRRLCMYFISWFPPLKFRLVMIVFGTGVEELGEGRRIRQQHHYMAQSWNVLLDTQTANLRSQAVK